MQHVQPIQFISLIDPFEYPPSLNKAVESGT